jgi:hypothetical protein
MYTSAEHRQHIEEKKAETGVVDLVRQRVANGRACKTANNSKPVGQTIVESETEIPAAAPAPSPAPSIGPEILRQRDRISQVSYQHCPFKCVDAVRFRRTTPTLYAPCTKSVVDLSVRKRASGESDGPETGLKRHENQSCGPQRRKKTLNFGFSQQCWQASHAFACSFYAETNCTIVTTQRYPAHCSAWL